MELETVIHEIGVVRSLCVLSFLDLFSEPHQSNDDGAWTVFDVRFLERACEGQLLEDDLLR